ncbi:MAG: hypothetical protein QNJ72_26830 [Pleurocapsa sp. MO_226.B13]|nr:hypothetical protein [Pleurocapsa sp. MO_226.B13]
MSFALISWCQQAVLLIVIICFYSGSVFPCFASQKRKLEFSSNHNYLEANYQKTTNLLAQKMLSCQGIEVSYQEVYSFETENYYINICQFGDDFYYYRQSKSNLENDLLIPAEVVFGGKVFQATDGKTTYFVGKDGDRYYSSVMHNDDEIVFEPELRPEPQVFANIRQRRANLSSRNALDRPKSDRTATRESDRPQDRPNNTENSSVCTQDRTAFDPEFDDWQNLLGKSPAVANKYAINHGYNFVYDRKAPDRASIRTNEGTIVNLNIATTSKTIERICVQFATDTVNLLPN